MAYWRWPGSKPWVQTTVGMTQTADWDEGGAAGLLKFDDGTIWCWNGEMAHTAFDYFPWWAVINEHVPGAKAWEQITADYWSDIVYPAWGNPEDEWLNGATGELIDGGLMSDHWTVAHDGGDKSYWFNIWGDQMNWTEVHVYIISKENRTWELKTIDDSNFALLGQSVIWNGYVWFLTYDSVLVGDDNYVMTARLNRMDADAPYTSVIAREWVTTDPSDVIERYEVNPDTGLPSWFDTPFGGYSNANPAVGVDDDGYMYFMTNATSYMREDYDPPVPAAGVAGLWRLDLSTLNEWELLYYDWREPNWINARGGSYNLPDGAVNDRWHGPLPIGIGMVQNWWYSKIGVRDGWLYWVNNTGSFAMISSGWTGGHTFCRIRLSDIAGGSVAHQPESPIFEVISMTTGAEESFYNWDDTTYWGNHGGYGWKDGVDSCHAFVENMWYFDDDGSIVFLHHEYPDFYMEPGGFYPPYIISRLSPPEAIPITFNLVFEGEEMKGYGHAREVPAKTRIGNIELSGE